MRVCWRCWRHAEMRARGVGGGRGGHRRVEPLRPPPPHMAVCATAKRARQCTVGPCCDNASRGGAGEHSQPHHGYRPRLSAPWRRLEGSPPFWQMGEGGFPRTRPSRRPSQMRASHMHACRPSHILLSTTGTTRDHLAHRPQCWPLPAYKAPTKRTLKSEGASRRKTQRRPPWSETADPSNTRNTQRARYVVLYTKKPPRAATFRYPSPGFARAAGTPPPRPAAPRGCPPRLPPRPTQPQ